MSVIQIQSLQRARAAKKADSISELKNTGHEGITRTPVLVGASIAALVLYLKASHAAAAPKASEDQPQAGSGEDQQAIQGGDASVLGTSDQGDAGLASSHRSSAFPIDPLLTDSPAPVLAEGGLVITGVSSLQLNFGIGYPIRLTGYHLSNAGSFDIFANDNGSGQAKQSRSSRSGSSLTMPNRTPTTSGPVLLDTGFAAMAVLFTLDDLLQGSADPDKDFLTISDVKASAGDIIPVEDGYMYIGDATGPVTLTYSISDGQHVVPQTANFTVAEHAATLGTAQTDTIVGSDSADLIQVGAGNDVVKAGVGVDTIYGGEGDDEIHGGDGNDSLFGGAGNDKLFGEAGNDLFFAGAGNDQIYGGDGSDVAYAGEGDDVVLGEAGDDNLFGDSGNDALLDGTGSDYVGGGTGDDEVLAAADGEGDTFDGGTGTDVLSYSESRQAVTFDIAKGQVTGSDSGADAFTGFEVFVGGDGDDVFITGSESVVLVGGDGNDVFDILTDAILAASPVRHVVEDFEVGDRVRISLYDIFEENAEQVDFLQQMNAAGDGEAPDNAVPIKFRIDDKIHKTYIEADFDHDDSFEVSVELDGFHSLLLHLNSVA